MPVQRKQGELITCPTCGDFDLDAGSDRDDDGNLVDEWWECRGCGRSWRFADDRLNPSGGKHAA